MSSHSQFKRYNILQELEQAIKKKTQEKYRSKSKNKYSRVNARLSDIRDVKPIKSPAQEKNPYEASLGQASRKNTTNKTMKYPEFKYEYELA